MCSHFSTQWFKYPRTATVPLGFQFTRLNIREGTGDPLQYSCLETPMDGRAWWAAVHGVARSRTRLSDFHFQFSLSCSGEGNGNPLQCSCLENPRDGGAWWAAIYGSHRVGHDWSDLAAAAVKEIGVEGRLETIRMNSPGKNTGVGCHFLLQGIFMT